MTNEPKSWQRKPVVVKLEREVEDVDQYRHVFVAPSGERLNNIDLSLLRWIYLESIDPVTNWPKRERALYCKTEDKLYPMSSLEVLKRHGLEV